jgi:hypothetical protein
MEIFVKGEEVGVEIGARVGVSDGGCSVEEKGVEVGVGVKVGAEVTVFAGGFAVGIKGSGNCLIGLGV